MSAPAPSLVEGVEIEFELEEVAVCELCGLVVREPAPPACPACGGGFG
jgi:rubrerythrin